MQTLVTAFAFAVAASAASAATVSITKTNAPVDIVAAQAAALQPSSTTGVFDADVTGSIGGVRRSPFDTIPALATTGRYNSVRGRGAATYDFADTQSAFSLIWGSPDSYNTLSFFLGADQIDLGVAPGVAGKGVTGAEIAALALNQPQQVGLATVAFSGFLFDSVVFESGSNAFEFAMVESTPAPVPLPAAAWMLLAGLSALAVAARKRAPV